MMHASQRQDLIDLRLRAEQAHSALPALCRLVQRDQGPQAAAIEKGHLGEINLDVPMRFDQIGTDPIPKLIGVCCSQFFYPGDAQSLTLVLNFHAIPAFTYDSRPGKYSRWVTQGRTLLNTRGK